MKDGRRVLPKKSTSSDLHGLRFFDFKVLVCFCRDVQLTGRCRAVLTPTLNRIPFLGGVQLSFLSQPKIDFNLDGLADIADMPGVRSKVRKGIMSDVNKRYVYPNKISFQTTGQANPELVHSLRPKGVLFLKVI